MARKVKKAQAGSTVNPAPLPPFSGPQLSQRLLQGQFGGYRARGNPPPMITGVTPFNPGVPTPPRQSALGELMQRAATPGDRGRGSRVTTQDEYDGSNRYTYFQPSSMGVDNEDTAGQYQSFGSKAINGVTKGLILTGTTFLQSTVGLVNGTYQAISDGKFSSFYDNDFNRALDDINKWSEDQFPNYYTQKEANANWYSPDYLLTGNFVFDGVVKNLGFAAGAYFSGGVFTRGVTAASQVFSSVPKVGKIISVGKGAEAVAATEKGLSAANKGAGVYGEVVKQSDKLINQFNLLNPGQRAVVAGLSTTGEAGIEALHNSNEFRNQLIDEYKQEYGVLPDAEALQVIDDAVDGAGNSSFFINVGILSASNYIMFPRIGRSTFKADKNSINNLVTQTDDIIYDGAKYTTKVSKLPAILSRLNKIRPYTFSVTESIEEAAQYGTTVGTADYYNKQYNNEATDWLSSVGVGITRGVFSDQGAKNALIGGFSGAIMTGRGRYRRNTARESNTQEALKALNRRNPMTGESFKLSDFTSESIYSVNRAGVIGQEMEEAVKNGDALAYKNLEQQYIINFLTPRIKYGRYGIVQDQINDILNLAQTEEGFAQLQAEGKVQDGDTRQAFIARMQKFKQVASDVNSLYNSLNIRYGGIVEVDPKTGDKKRVYTPEVMNKMIYAASMVADFDARIPALIQEINQLLPELNLDQVLADIVSGETQSFNDAVDQIVNLDMLSEIKDELGGKLNDLAALALQREQMLNEYENIKTNPKLYQENKVEEDRATETVRDDVENFVVTTSTGEKSLEVGGEYFVGQGVDFEGETPLDEPVVVAGFTVLSQKEDGSIEVKDNNGNLKTITPDALIKYKVAKKSDLINNKTANFYYRHRNNVFQFNFGKNYGGKRNGRLMYDNGKLFFVYKDANGTVVKKQLSNKFFLAQEGFNEPRIKSVGKINKEQVDALSQFVSKEELAKQEQTLEQNRENRLKIMHDLGVESKRRLEEINKQLERDKKKLSDVKKDLDAIYKMREGGPRIKLKYSKAQKNFTKALNKLTEMQADTEKRIGELQREAEELEFNISYFEAFEVDLLDLPGNSSEFLKELKDQIKLLEQNGKAVNREIAANNNLIKSIEDMAKRAAKLLKSALGTTYVYNEDYGDYLRDLLDKASKGENLLSVWPLLKQELANFNLTNDIQKDTSVPERETFDALQKVEDLTSDLESLRAEYRAKKVIVDRFQRIMDEYVAEQQAQDRIAKDTKLVSQVMNTASTGPVIEAEPKSFNPVSKKNTDILPRATIAPSDGKPHQVRANRFGANLDKFENRDQIRAVYVTRATQDQRLDGVVERILDDGSPELMEKFGDSIIVMVMMDTAGNLVDVNGQPIPEGQSELDNAIYQTLPESGFRNGEMFREGTPQELKDQINKQYNQFRKDILDRTMVGAPFRIEASFGIPIYEQDANNNDILGDNSVVEAQLISEEDLTKRNVIFIPTTNKSIFKGTVAYNQPMGSVFLDLPNGYVKLRNRKHTIPESQAIYDAILALSKQIADPNQGVTSDESVRMLNFLKGVTYWGLPANKAGQNSVFFEKVSQTSVNGLKFYKLVLRVGPLVSIDFNPSSIQKNKDLVLETLGQMYNNINNSYTQDITQEFEQITSVTEDGSVTSIIWPNYQTYLLSKNVPGKGKRENFELPLHTTLKTVVEGSEEVNRKGIYFVNEDSAGDFITEVPPAPTQRIEVIKAKPEGPTIVLDGQTTNTYTSPQGKQILFRASKDTTKENLQDKIQIIQGGDLVEVVETIEKGGKDKSLIKNTIYNYIAPSLSKVKSKEVEMTAQMSPEMVQKIKEKRQKEGKKPISDDIQAALERGRNNQNNEVLREVTTKSVEVMDSENWKDLRSWMDKNLPQVPLVRVRNIIRAGGRDAWGMFQDNAMYVYENAEVGTAYHEAFEAVYAMYLDSNEIAQLNEEFKARRGSFVDRPTGRTVKYKDATADQIREQLAEEFRDYIQDQKKPKGNFFVRLFNSLKKFIEGWFVTNRTEELFKRIDTGGFAQGLEASPNYVANYIQVGPDAVFRVAGLSDVITHDTIQHMTYLTLRDLIKNNESLFNIKNVLLDETRLYNRLKTEVYASIAQKAKEYKDIRSNFEGNQEALDEIDLQIENVVNLMQQVEEAWPDLIKKHKEYMLSFGVTFDEGAMSMASEDMSNKGYNLDATKVDNFKKTNIAVRLLLGTIPLVTTNENGNIRFTPSSINGVKLIPTTQAYITVLETVNDSVSIEDMLEKLRVLAVNDPNYNALYKRVSGRNATEGAVDLNNLTQRHELTLLAALWNTFKKQDPVVKVVNVLENGETVVTDANLASAARQMQQQYLNSIVTKSKRGNGIFKESNGIFNPDTATLAKYPLNSVNNMLRFLEKIGIPFTEKEYSGLTTEMKKKFTSSVNGIKKSIENTKNIKLFSVKALDMSKRLLDLATVKVAASNPEVSSTYFNIEGERTQTFIGPNAASELHNTMISVSNKEELGSTPFKYILTDVFAQGSTIVNRLFDAEGNLRTDAVNLFKPGYAGGVVNGQKGTARKSSQLQFPDRLRQELNLNLNGQFLNLVPGDSSLEHMLEMGLPITERDISQGGAVMNTIFKAYFISEVGLAREERAIVELEGRETTDLRFFKEILGEELHSKIKESVLDPALTAEEVYDLNAIEIIEATTNFITTKKNQQADFLMRFNVLQQKENENTGELLNQYEIQGVQGMQNLSIQELNRKLFMLQANYIVANIEMHKILYGDPYLYKDELKRTKSFLSPRQPIISNSPQWNAVANRLWNRGYQKFDPGYTQFTRDGLRTVTHGDIISVIDLPNYKEMVETDGAGIITYKAYRQIRIRANNWNDAEEKQYEYDIAFYKQAKNQTLSKREQDLIREGNPGVQSAYTPLKPIVSGARLNENFEANNVNDVVLDKYALYPLSYRIMQQVNAGSNGLKLFDKMLREDIDYIVFESGRKVGAGPVHSTYNDDGSFNDAPYENVINVPFNIISIQSEVPSKEDGRVTRASQITKLITLDYLNNGKPVDYKGTLDQWTTLTADQKIKASPIYAEIIKNNELLDEMTKEGLDQVFRKLGITKDAVGYIVTDMSPATKTLREEIFKRETNDNISSALDGFLVGDVILEATPAYNQVRNILYSIVQKNIVRPKIAGGQKVQIPSSLFESNRVEKTTINGKTGYTSDVLKFYTNKDGERVMEVMVGRWFPNMGMTDAELLDYLNNTEEGQKALRGVAFRIPTQKQNSIDAIKVKQFLPKEFGDSVVVPSAIVEKVGSDFDIDKLFMYLKNMVVINGDLQLVPFYGYGDQAKKRFGELYDSGALLSKAQQKELAQRIKDFESGTAEGNLVEAIFGETFDNQDVIDDYILELKDKGIRQTVIDRMYARSLENEYIQSTENLVTFPENFERLIVPNDASQLKALSEEIVDKTRQGAFDYRSVGNLLDQRFMARLRNAFVQGKRGIGIAAVNQTNLALNQHSLVFIPLENMKFRRKNTVTLPDGKEVVSLSGVKNAAGDFISDINGQVIDGMVDIAAGPWIIEMGITPTTASAWLYMIKAGVPVDTVTYFMNQPIIRDYLAKIEESGYTWLFIDDFAKELKENKYGSAVNLTEEERTLLPFRDYLRSQLGKTNFSNKDKAYQRFILDEFLNVAKQARDLFIVTQGTNWDTSTFNDPYLIFKKTVQYSKALTTGFQSMSNDGVIKPAAQEIIESTFLKETVNALVEAREGLSTLLTSDQQVSREVIQKVLLPYTSLPDRQFVKVSRRAVNNFYDYAVQTDQGLNMLLKSMLIDENGTASQVENFVTEVLSDPNHPLYDNAVVNLLETDPSKRVGDVPNNIKLRNNDRKVYEQNTIIYAFRELKAAIDPNLYRKIVITSILQSGLNNSQISFTSLIPYEDFQLIYNETLSTLNKNGNLMDFWRLGMFERNNWGANNDIVNSLRAVWIQQRNGEYVYNPAMAYLPKNVKAAVAAGTIPQVMTIKEGTRVGQQDYVVYNWNNPTFSKQERKEMASKGDFSFVNKGLFVKVYDAFGTPLLHTYTRKGETTPQVYFVYKHVNALGDGYRAQEYYTGARPSVFDNGTLKAEEKDNLAIIDAWKGKAQVRPAPKSTGKGVLVTKKGDTVQLSLGGSKVFNVADINVPMLLDLGYTEERAGEILKIICK